MLSLILRATTSQTFRTQSIDLSDVLATLDMAGAEIRVLARAVGRPDLVFSTGNGGAVLADNGWLTLVKPASEVLAAAPSYSFAAIVEWPGTTKVARDLFAGQILFSRQPTLPADAGLTGTADIGATVTIDGYPDEMPVPLPVSATQILAAAAQARDEAAESADAAADARTDAEAARDLAQQWATKPTGEVVTGQGYSAKKHATDAAASAGAAATSAADASTSAAGASGSATTASVAAATATTKASEASVSAGAAAGSATAAAGSATAAAGSATTATNQAATASTQAGNASTSATAASASASAASTSAGNAATSAAAAATSATSAGNSAAAASTSASNAATSATNSAGSATSASSSAATATTKASEAAASATSASGSATTTAGYLTSVSTNALLAQGYMNSAAAYASGVAAATNLSSLLAAARALGLSTSLAAVFLYDTARDENPNWPDQCLTQTMVTETLSTATRGTTAKYPKRMLLVGYNVAAGNVCFEIRDATDPTCPVWASWVANSNPVFGVTSSSAINAISARCGKIVILQTTNGAVEIDLILDVAMQHTASVVYVYNGLVNRNVNAASAYQMMTGASGTPYWSVLNANCNSVTMTVAAMTQPNPLRCGLPNPTIAIGTNGGVSVIRNDNVVCNTSTGDVYQSVSFGPDGLLWYAAFSVVAVATPAIYLAGSWSYIGIAQFTIAQVGVGTSPKVCAIGRNEVAVAGSLGLAQIKLDPTNPAASLIRNKTTTFDAGWVPGAQGALKAVVAAESSAALAALADAATLTDRSPAGANYTVVGGLSRTVVATGADLAGLSGWGVGNYARGPAIAFASGDFEIPVSIANASATGSQVYFDHAYYTGGAYSGARVSLTSSGSTLTFAASDSTNSASIVKTSAWVAGASHHIRCIYRSAATRFELWINNVLAGTASRGSVGSLTNASANTFLGVDAALANACASTAIMAWFAPALVASTPDLIAFMHAAQVAAFQPNAKTLLTGANVQSLAWDEDTQQLAAANSTAGVDVFSRGVRGANDNSTTATNRVRNSGLTGISVGAVGSYLDAAAMMATNIGGGLAKSIVAVGPGYIDLRINGTANASSYFLIQLNRYQDAVAANGQNWTVAAQVALVAGSWANVTSPAICVDECNSGGSALATTTTALSGIGSTLTQKTVSRTFNQASAAYAQAYINGSFNNGAAVDFTLRIYQPYLAQVASFSAFTDGLSNSANAKAVAFAGGDLAVGTAAGLDVWLQSAPGLRETAKARRAANVYDPTWGQFSGLTTDATPTVFASVTIPEGKAFRFRATVAAVQYGGTATEKATYDVTGLVSRDLGGNVSVVTTTTTVSEATASMDCIAQANTTAQTLELKATGKAATRMQWLAGLEFYDAGLQNAA